jgi:hypothetical protein
VVSAFNLPENAHGLSGAGVEGTGAGRGLAVTGAAGAAPVVVRDRVGTVTVVEIVLVEPYTSAATTIAEIAAIIQGHGVPPLLFCSRLSRRSSSGSRRIGQRVCRLIRHGASPSALMSDGEHVSRGEGSCAS